MSIGEGSYRLVHHETALKAYNAAMEWWQEEQNIGRRCGKCWLRTYDCFCPEVAKIKVQLSTFQEKMAIRMCIYYHHLEIGRSANTAHLYEAIYSNSLPDNVKSSCETILFGDTDKETKLIDDINEEQESNCVQTCILYPTNDAVSLNEWLESRSDDAKLKPVRIVVLDGTYPQADRQWRHLSRALKLVHGKQLPLVKLDLESGKVSSALLGIQSQPGIDKLCSFQAMILALQQAHQTPELCDYLSTCLDKWLEHILLKRVKLGKPKQNFKLPEGTEAADYVKKFQKINAAKKWTESNGPLPEGFTPISDNRMSEHNPRVNNPYSSKASIERNNVSEADQVITPSPAVVVYDLPIHSSIRLNQTKLFYVYILQ